MRRLLLTLFALLALAAPATAATGTLMPAAYQTVLDTNGNPVSGSCIWSYVAGTSTLVSTYTDVALSVAHTNPIEADAAGRFVAYLTPGSSYKFIFEGDCTPPAHATVIRTVDNVLAVPASSANLDVSGTAGEALTAGECAYLSDGSGAKTAGSWYKCDPAQPYSSVTNVTGVVPASIASLGTGLIRLHGTVTGLSALTVGASYYASTAGALTSTPPTTNLRRLGQADTTTTLHVVSNPPLFLTSPIVTALACGRLTLTTALPITTANVTAATTLYYTPISGCNQITLYNGTFTQTYTLSEISIAVPATTAQVYDVWVYDNAGTLTLELLAWTNDTTRATAITLQNGFLAKAATPTRRYIGNMRTTGVSGQTEDSLTNRFVWNYYHRVDRVLQVLEATASWTYNVNTIRQANGAVGNQVNYLVGVSEDPVEADVSVTVTQVTGTNNAAVGVGVDSTTTFAATQSVQVFSGQANVNGTLRSFYRGYPGIGKHSLMWNEVAFTTVTTTFWGASGAVGAITLAGASASGLLGKIRG